MAVTVKNTFIQIVEDDSEEELPGKVLWTRHQSEPDPKSWFHEESDDDVPRRGVSQETIEDASQRLMSQETSAKSCDDEEEEVDEVPRRGISQETIAVSCGDEAEDGQSESGSDYSWEGGDLEVPWARVVTHDGLEPTSPVRDVVQKKQQLTISLSSLLDTSTTDVADDPSKEQQKQRSQPQSMVNITKNSIAMPSISLVSVLPPTAADVASGKDAGLTVMVRNVPYKYSRDLFVKELDASGFRGLYDFVYLPMDMGTRLNKGYAFVNFISSCHADAFMNMYRNRTMSQFESDKRISVTPAVLQGFEANYAHYSQKYINQQDETLRPLFLRKVNAQAMQAISFGQSKPLANKKIKRAGKSSLIDKAAQQPVSSSVGPATTVVNGNHPNVLVQRKSKPQQAQTQASAQGPAISSKGQAIPAQSLNIPQHGIKFCTSCGTKAAASFRFCQGCGHTLRQ